MNLLTPCFELLGESFDVLGIYFDQDSIEGTNELNRCFILQAFKVSHDIVNELGRL